MKYFLNLHAHQYISKMITGIAFCILLCVPMVSTASEKENEGSGKGTENSASNPEDEVIFSANAESPWRFYIGSMANWMVPVEGPLTRSHKSKTVTVRVIDYLQRDDAYQVEWAGGLGQVYWQEFNPHDYRNLAEAGGALSLVLRIDEKPDKKVELKMDCGYPCGGAVNVTNIFKAVPEDQWFRMSIGVSCFGDAGANLANVLSPTVIATAGKLKLSLADVSLLTDPPLESVIACK